MVSSSKDKESILNSITKENTQSKESLLNKAPLTPEISSPKPLTQSHPYKKPETQKILVKQPLVPQTPTTPTKQITTPQLNPQESPLKTNNEKTPQSNKIAKEAPKKSSWLEKLFKKINANVTKIDLNKKSNPKEAPAKIAEPIAPIATLTSTTTPTLAKISTSTTVLTPKTDSLPTKNKDVSIKSEPTPPNKSDKDNLKIQPQDTVVKQPAAPKKIVLIKLLKKDNNLQQSITNEERKPQATTPYAAPASSPKAQPVVMQKIIPPTTPPITILPVIKTAQIAKPTTITKDQPKNSVQITEKKIESINVKSIKKNEKAANLDLPKSRKDEIANTPKTLPQFDTASSSTNAILDAGKRILLQQYVKATQQTTTPAANSEINTKNQPKNNEQITEKKPELIKVKPIKKDEKTANIDPAIIAKENTATSPKIAQKQPGFTDTILETGKKFFAKHTKHNVAANTSPMNNHNNAANDVPNANIIPIKTPTEKPSTTTTPTISVKEMPSNNANIPVINAEKEVNPSSKNTSTTKIKEMNKPLTINNAEQPATKSIPNITATHKANISKVNPEQHETTELGKINNAKIIQTKAINSGEPTKKNDVKDLLLELQQIDATKQIQAVQKPEENTKKTAKFPTTNAAVNENNAGYPEPVLIINK